MRAAGRPRRTRPSSTTSSWYSVAVWISSAAQPTATAWSSGAPVARAASTASRGRSRLPPAPSRWAPTCGIAPIGLSIRSARRASTTFISSLTRATIPSRLEAFRPADTADIFITDPAPVTTFLNIQK